MRASVLVGGSFLLACNGGSSQLAQSETRPLSGDGIARAPTVLASNQNAPSTIAIDEEWVYWVNASTMGGVYKVAKAGGAPTALYETSMSDVSSLAQDRMSIYLALEGSIIAVPKAGGSPKVVTAARTKSLAVANGDVYWVDQNTDGSGLLRKAPVHGGTPTAVALPGNFTINIEASPTATSVVAATDAIYVSVPEQGILRAPLDGGAAVLVEVLHAKAMAFDNDSIYFGTKDTIDVVPKTGGSSRHLVPLANPAGVAVDRSFVYFVDNVPDGKVLKLAPHDTTPSVLADHQGAPHALAVDDTSVYWNSTDEGAIKKIAK
jgi:hypothetical protein